jgi:hypothetical protein
MRSPAGLVAKVDPCACARAGDPVLLPPVKTFALLLALFPLATACNKELGELCSENSDCETDVCRPVTPGASDVNICTASPPCGDEAVDIDGDCIRPCSAGCPDGTVCHPLAQGCLAACTGTGQCRNNACNLATGLCE